MSNEDAETVLPAAIVDRVNPGLKARLAPAGAVGMIVVVGRVMSAVVEMTVVAGRAMSAVVGTTVTDAVGHGVCGATVGKRRQKQVLVAGAA